MSTWICPNTKCTFDKQLKPGQHCPLCGTEAREYKFSEFGNLFKEKWSLKKSMESTEEHEHVLGKMKFCPKCGSTNVFWAQGLPQLWSIWECKECNYRGPLILEDNEMAKKLRNKWKEKTSGKSL